MPGESQDLYTLWKEGINSIIKEYQEAGYTQDERGDLKAPSLGLKNHPALKNRVTLEQIHELWQAKASTTFQRKWTEDNQSIEYSEQQKEDALRDFKSKLESQTDKFVATYRREYMAKTLQTCAGIGR